VFEVLSSLKAQRQPDVVGVRQGMGRILRTPTPFWFATRKNISRRLQNFTDLLRMIYEIKIEENPWIAIQNSDISYHWKCN
jgi:hypothetical protein